ncbi:MAG TPA: hypothetical protein VHL52_11205 [Acidimicrobiia bacterium]|nr:hypothetical protein [Acidimicrobiia bacterium]
MTQAAVPRVGAPVVEAFPPLPGTASARFHEWVLLNDAPIKQMLRLLTDRWQPAATFLEINFMHPDLGPAGALVLTTHTIDVTMMRRRAERLVVIPHRELGEILTRLERGETVVVGTHEMPDPLARRYLATPFEWSLNVPVCVDGSWVASVGAVATEVGFSHPAIAGFEAMAGLLRCDFAADQAWEEFSRLTVNNRLLRLLG